jgi:hypothetical protein
MKFQTRRQWRLAAMLVAAAAAATAFCDAANAANAASVTTYDPNSLVSALQGAGYKAQLTADKDGNPYIESGAGGSTITISFSGCTRGSRCDQVEFISVWNCGDDYKTCTQSNTTWNAKERFSHSILTGNNIALYYHLLFDKNGISPSLFIDNFEYFSNDDMQLVKILVEGKGK